jgi:hypothetical protein
MLQHVIYFSKSIKQMQEDDLISLLQQSRDWNKQHNLSGMLVYMQGGFLSKNAGRFMQVIEGSKDEVDYIFGKIKQDSRHEQINIINYQPIEKRNFNDWQMGFQSVDVEAGNDVNGFFELNDDFLKSEKFKKSNMALNFLKSFYSTDMNTAAI